MKKFKKFTVISILILILIYFIQVLFFDKKFPIWLEFVVYITLSISSILLYLDRRDQK
jgi:hypothetical protein